MRADHRPNGIDIVRRVFQVFLKGAVDRLFQGGRTAGDRYQFAAENAHLGNIRVFFLDIHLTHVNLAGNAYQRAGGGQRHTVLAGASLGDHFLLAHELGQQRFTQAVIDLVRPGVVQVFSLEMNLRAAELFRQPLGVEDRTRATDVIGKQTGQLLLKVFALTDFFVCGVDIIHCLLQLRRYQLTTIGAEVAVGIGHGGKTRVLGHGLGFLTE